MVKLTAQEIVMEYCRCVADPIHTIETYLKTQDVTSGGYVPFRLFPKQKELVRSYEDYQKSIATKSRQAGVTTTTAAYFAVKAVLAAKNSPEKMVIITNRLESSQKILGQVEEFIVQLCENPWVLMDIEAPNPNIKKPKDIFSTHSKKELVLAHNGSSIKAISSGKNSSRTLTATWLFFDEAAFIENGDIIFTSALPLISTGGKVTMISTANGRDLLYHPTYVGAVAKTNGFNLVEMRWFQDPRFNKDLQWIKGDEIIDEDEFSDESFFRKLDEGYKPTSTWYRTMCAGYSGNIRAIAQELDVDFLNSGGNAVTDVAQKMQREQNMIETPFFQDPECNEMWVWKTPEEVVGKRLVMAVDVASGSGADFSSIQILDCDCVDEQGNPYIDQIAEYYGKIKPDELAYIAYKYAILYNCFVVVDCIGGYGYPVVQFFMDNNYKDLYYDTLSNPSSLLVANKKINSLKDSNGKPAGMHSPTVRPLMINRLIATIESNLIKLRSIRAITELETWVWVNNKVDHTRNAHDDALMALAMAVFVFENAFKSIKISTSTMEANLAVFSTNTYTGNIKKQINNNNEKVNNSIQTEKQKPKPSIIFGGSYGSGNFNASRNRNSRLSEDSEWLLRK